MLYTRHELADYCKNKDDMYIINEEDAIFTNDKLDDNALFSSYLRSNIIKRLILFRTDASKLPVITGGVEELVLFENHNLNGKLTKDSNYPSTVENKYFNMISLCLYIDKNDDALYDFSEMTSVKSMTLCSKISLENIIFPPNLEHLDWFYDEWYFYHITRRIDLLLPVFPSSLKSLKFANWNISNLESLKNCITIYYLCIFLIVYLRKSYHI